MKDKGHLVERHGKRGRVWYYVFDVPREHDGKREQQRERLGSMPRSHAVAAARKILAQVEEGTWVKERRDLTVEQFVTSWLKAIKYDVATNTHVRYAGLMTQHVIPRVGKVQLAKLTPQHLTAIYQAVRDEGLSPQTALHVHRAIHTALNYGVKVTKNLRENVAARLRAPKVERRVSTIITPEKVRSLIEAARGTRLEAPVMLSALTGMRRGELLALKWSTVSLDKGSLYVAKALAHTRGHLVEFKEPKSKTSRRVLPLAPECVALLRAHKEAQDAVKAKASDTYLEMDLVFPNPDGAPWPPDSFSVQFAKLARTAECQGFRLHDLRHAFATLTLAGGVSVREVSDLLGHSQTALTLSTYSHAIPGAGQAAVSNLAKTLLGAKGAASP